MIDPIKPIQTPIEKAMYGLFKERINKNPFFLNFLIEKILGEKKYTAQTYFAFLSKLVFYAKRQFMPCTTRVLISDSPIRIYKILKVKNLFLAETMLEKKERK
jgi:hypothetical protein